jgi:hypothetical protein
MRRGGRPAIASARIERSLRGISIVVTRSTESWSWSDSCRSRGRWRADTNVAMCHLGSFQVACLGLVKAIDRFELSRDVALSSFAVPTIMGEIKRYFRDRTWAMRVPRDLQERVLVVERVADALATDLHRQPTISEIAHATGLDDEQVLQAQPACGAYRTASLSSPLNNGDAGKETLGEAVGATDPGFAQVEDRATVEHLLQALTPANSRSCACALSRISPKQRSAGSSVAHRCRSRGSCGLRSRGCDSPPNRTIRSEWR